MVSNTVQKKARMVVAQAWWACSFPHPSLRRIWHYIRLPLWSRARCSLHSSHQWSHLGGRDHCRSRRLQFFLSLTISYCRHHRGKERGHRWCHHWHRHLLLIQGKRICLESREKELSGPAAPVPQLPLASPKPRWCPSPLSAPELLRRSSFAILLSSLEHRESSHFCFRHPCKA